MLPSPTAAATRLTGLERTSPQAKMPGTLVSSSRGSRSSSHRRVPQAGVAQVGAGEHVAALVEGDLGRKPAGLGVGADEDVEPVAVLALRLRGRPGLDVYRLQLPLAVRPRDLALGQHADVLPRLQLGDQVVGHALREARAAAEDRDPAGVIREVERRLARGIARSDDVDVLAVGAARIGARGAVGDPLAGEPLEAVDLEAPPRDAAGEDDRLRLEDVAAVEVDAARRRVDPLERPGDEDLGAEALRLLQRPPRQLVAGDAGREPEVVLDPRRRARLPARRLALDHDRAQSLGGAVHRRREAGRPSSDDHRVVRGVLGLGLELEELRDAAQRRRADGLPARSDTQGGVVLAGRERPAPFRLRIGVVRRDPCVGELVAVEEPAQLAACCLSACRRRRLPAAQAARRRRSGGRRSGPARASRRRR